MRKTLAERIWPRVDKSGDCWIWTGPTNASGYGQIGIVRPETGKPGTMFIHRWSYEQWHGPIPEGLQIDHLCRVRNCCNPAHLEAVTPRENTLRGTGITAMFAQKTACPKGHPYDEKNTRLVPNGRECRECRKIAAHEAWKKKPRVLTQEQKDRHKIIARASYLRKKEASRV